MRVVVMVVMVKVHWMLMVCSLARIVFQKRGLSVAHIVAALPRTWPELIICLTKLIPSSKNLVKDAYIAMRQVKLIKALLVEPPWWLAWLNALTGWKLDLWFRHMHCWPKELPLLSWLTCKPIDTWRWYTLLLVATMYFRWYKKLSDPTYRFYWTPDSWRGKSVTWICCRVIRFTCIFTQRSTVVNNAALLIGNALLISLMAWPSWHGSERMCKLVTPVLLLEHYSNWWNCWLFDPIVSLVGYLLQQVKATIMLLVKPVFWLVWVGWLVYKCFAGIVVTPVLEIIWWSAKLLWLGLMRVGTLSLPILPVGIGLVSAGMLLCGFFLTQQIVLSFLIKRHGSCLLCTFTSIPGRRCHCSHLMQSLKCTRCKKFDLNPVQLKSLNHHKIL